MRTTEYLSPSSISLYVQDIDKFYRRYLANTKEIREGQNQPMAIGSAFDAFVKSYLHQALFGRDNDPRFDLRALFEAQVDEPLRQWAFDNGKYVFEQYKQAGCLSDLMLLLNSAETPPRFEFEIKGVVNGYRDSVRKDMGEVVLLGKPDCHFITKHGNVCVLDWKVNGYCSNYPKSPEPYYLALRSAGRTHHGTHRKCVPVLINEMFVNRGCYLDDLDSSWARQLAIYGWLMGSPVGSDFLTVIHQIVCSPNTGGLPSIRVAEHVNYISSSFQNKVFNLAVNIWEDIKSGYVFRDLNYEDNLRKIESLDNPVKSEPIINIPLNI